MDKRNLWNPPILLATGTVLGAATAAVIIALALRSGNNLTDPWLSFFGSIGGGLVGGLLGLTAGGLAWNGVQDQIHAHNEVIRRMSAEYEARKENLTHKIIYTAEASITEFNRILRLEEFQLIAGRKRNTIIRSANKIDILHTDSHNWRIDKKIHNLIVEVNTVIDDFNKNFSEYEIPKNGTISRMSFEKKCDTVIEACARLIAECRKHIPEWNTPAVDAVAADAGSARL